MNEIETGALMAYLIFDGLPTDLSFEKINAYLKKNWTEDLVLEDVQSTNDAYVFKFKDYQVATIMKMDTPYPQEELSDRCESTWWWPEALDGVKDQNSHYIVALTGGEEPPVQKHTHLTALVCALISETKPLGVMWNGVVLQKSGVFVEIAEESRTAEPPLPLSLWVDFQVYQPAEDLFNVFSWGLESLGFPDLEVHESSQDPAELLEMVQMVALYCVENDIIFENGETFGFDEEGRIPVAYGPSVVDPSKEVLILEAH